MKRNDYYPMLQEHLLKLLKVSKEEQDLAQNVIGELIRDGVIVVDKNRLALKGREYETVVTGTIHVNPRGFGFVTPDDDQECKQTIFIPPGHCEDAVQGDHVEVTLVAKPRRPERGPEGRIAKVLKRARESVAGIVSDAYHKNRLTIYAPMLGPENPIIVMTKGAKIDWGTRVLVKITSWKNSKGEIRGDIEKILGNIEDPSIDVDCAIVEFEIPTDFPSSAIDEAKAYGKEVTQNDLNGRTDFTKDEVFTIDPTTARDFDDALCVTKSKDGYRLCVHIADVSHYVRPETALDQFAATRCNSVYFPRRCVPMLPEELSNELCSLKEGVVRLTASVVMDLDNDGNLNNYQIQKGFIKSQKRFTYEGAKQVLDGQVESPHKKTLELMVELCEKLKALRRARGSIDLALPETVVNVDKKGIPRGFTVVEYDITHQLVEEFMLKANEVVATHLSKQGKDSLYRIHQAPTEDEQADFFFFVHQLGFHLPETPTSEDIQAVFEKAKSTPYAQQLAISFIRTMKLAVYSPENVGHFGLSLDYYTHFTSPIRRYPDLIIHRLLFEKSTQEQNLSALALRCSDCERNAAKAENRVKLLKKLRYLEKHHEETFTATITKVFPMGFAFEVDVYAIEGVVFVSQLPDYYEYDREKAMLQTKHGKRFRLGDQIKVYPEFIDLIKSEVKWQLDLSV
ncbi:MAG: ribonuclease R [Chlamydiia bacterium]|nr:ribonuclease R [Chlamydiia bacterium]